MIGYVMLAYHRKRVEMSELLYLHATAGRAEPKAIDRLVKQWTKDGW